MTITFVFVLVGWLFSLCLHEFSHAWVAYKGGDYTVKERGYLSFNIFKYMDPITSIAFPVLIVLIGGIGLPGGAVYIQTNLIKSKAMQSLMSFAGPLSNFLLAVLLAFILHTGDIAQSTLGPALALLLFFQVTAFCLNLLPIPGLDGFGMLDPYLPMSVRVKARQFALHANVILLGVLLFVPPISNVFFGAMYGIAGVMAGNFELIREGLIDFRFWKH